jgi:hypothetical protein
MFKSEDAVWVDTSEYDLASPGTVSKSPGVVLAVMEGARMSYYVRVRLPLGAMMDLTVPAGKLASF